MTKPKALLFYQYLPPWRIDVFNEMAVYYDLTVVFTNANVNGFTYNRELLLNKLQNVKAISLNKGFTLLHRPVRFGVYRLIKEIKPNVIFSHEYCPTSVMIALYRNYNTTHKFKFFITTSDNVEIAKGVSGLKAIFRSYVLHYADGIIVYGSLIKQWYTNKFPKLKIGVCPNIQKEDSLLSYRKDFVPICNRYQAKFNLIDCNVILYIGRLEKIKGLDLLLNAFAETKEARDYKIVLVGNGSEKENLVNLSKRLNINDRVVFAGFYSDTQLYAWYDLANFFILPSIYEPFGAVVNEALVYGCPVMASKYIGASWFVSDNNGCLFDPKNKTNFIAVLNKACQNYRHKESNRKNLMNYYFKDFIKIFYTIYADKN